MSWLSECRPCQNPPSEAPCSVLCPPPWVRCRHYPFDHRHIEKCGSIKAKTSRSRFGTVWPVFTFARFTAKVLTSLRTRSGMQPRPCRRDWRPLATPRDRRAAPGVDLHATTARRGKPKINSAGSHYIGRGPSWDGFHADVQKIIHHWCRDRLARAGSLSGI